MVINHISIKKILVLRYRSIGDIILSYPTIDTLRNTYPNARIDMVVDDVFGDLCYAHPHLDYIILHQRKKGDGGRLANFWSELKFIMKIRKNRYDLVIDLHSGPRSAMLTLLSGARYRVGHTMRLRSRLCYNISPPGGDNKTHSIDVMLKTIAPLNPLAPKKKSLFLRYKEEDRRYATAFLEKYDVTEKDRVVMVHPGARVDFKRLPSEKMGEVVNWLVSEQGVKVVYTGTDRDISEISDIVTASRKPGLVITNMKLGQLAALMERCCLYVGNDSGPMHMAAALKVPLVAFFGPTDPAVWSPWGARGRIVRCSLLDCMPCDQKKCHRLGNNCMDRIEIKHIKIAITKVLNSKTAATSRY